MGINHITLVGEVVKKPEMRYTPNGIPTTQFQVAVKRPPRQEGQTNTVTDYLRIVTWRKLAETVNETLDRGDLISVEGRLLTRTYETPEGQRRKIIEVEAMNVEAIHSSQANKRGESEISEFDAMDAEPAFDDADEIPF